MRQVLKKYLVIVVVLLGWTVSIGVTMADELKEDTINIYDVSEGKYKEVKKIKVDQEELSKTLTEKQFHVTQKAGTEAPFTGDLLDNKKEGVYKCVVCGTDLFLSKTKYESGTGWPSFWEPVAKENVGEKEDNSLFMRRVEVYCPRCHAHLGHVFDDGPAPTNKRYCINSAALKFQQMKEQ